MVPESYWDTFMIARRHTVKIDLDKQLENPDGSPAVEMVREGEKAVEKPVTVRYVLMNAMLSQVDGDGQPIKGEEKIKRYDLWIRLKKAVAKGTLVADGKGGEVDNSTDFDPEDITFLRKAVLMYPTLVVGQIREILS
jgi:hypothetical protein